MQYGPAEVETRQMSREEFLKALLGEIDPLKYAGEGWFSTEEYQPGDVQDPFVKADVGREGEYYLSKIAFPSEREALLKLLRRV
jgi:hypothetical protein